MALNGLTIVVGGNDAKGKTRASTLNEIHLLTRVRPDLNQRASSTGQSANVVPLQTINKTMKKYPPLNCTILCKIEKITKKYVTVETVETRDPDSGPIVSELTMMGPNQATLENARKESGALPVRTWIDIAPSRKS